MWTYRFWHPARRAYQTLDCPAVTQADARASAIRFLRRENNRLRRATGGAWRVQLPKHINSMKWEG